MFHLFVCRFLVWVGSADRDSSFFINQNWLIDGMISNRYSCNVMRDQRDASEF